MSLKHVKQTIAGLMPSLGDALAQAQAELEKIASRNMMRVLRTAEAYSAQHLGDPPIENRVAE